MRYIIIILIFSLSLHTGIVQELDDNDLIPTKTATLIPTISSTIIPTPNNSNSQDNTQNTSNPAEPFTQTDLTILSGNVQRPNGIIWLDNKLYTACSGDWTLYEIDDTTGSTITFVFGIRNSHSLHAETTATGFNLWVPDFETNSLFRVDQNRAAPTSINNNLNGPWGIASIDENNFLVTNFKGNNITRINRNGQTRVVLDGLRSPAGIASDNEFIYFANTGSARRSIEWISYEDTRSSESIEAQSLVSGLQNTSGVVLTEDGYLYFTYSLGTRGVVGRIDPEVCRDGGCTNEQVEIVLYTDLPAPLAGLTISPDMRLFVHTLYRPEIYWVQLAT